jgi:hypothetical protein
MAIVTISQIKHRRGVKGTDPMPQLASAEFGWAVDAQELYIGNGTITEGAPVTGNTEILTEHSDLSALLTDYTYSGPFSGAVMLLRLPVLTLLIKMIVLVLRHLEQLATVLQMTLKQFNVPLISITRTSRLIADTGQQFTSRRELIK